MKRIVSQQSSATNKPFEVRGAAVVGFTDGKISRNSDYWDLATYMKQVGLTK
jgi:ketosteroid isomerase-like protein